MPPPDTGPMSPADDAAVPGARIVRPFTLTAGRTRPRVDLPMEAILDRQPLPGRAPDGLVGRILDVCDACSVAEVSAQVEMPVGVVRVLVGDLVEHGYLRVQDTLTESSTADERRDLMERTLRGLRAF